MTEYGIFNDESPDWTAEEAVESGFYSVDEAVAAIADRYSDDDELTIHAVEEPEESEEESEEESDSDSEDD